jgi:hypothetical protein
MKISGVIATMLSLSMPSVALASTFELTIIYSLIPNPDKGDNWAPVMSTVQGGTFKTFDECTKAAKKPAVILEQSNQMTNHLAAAYLCLESHDDEQ